MRSVNLIGYNSPFFYAFPWPGFPWFIVLDRGQSGEHPEGAKGYSLWLMLSRGKHDREVEKVIVRFLDFFDHTKDNICEWPLLHHSNVGRAAKEGKAQVFFISKNQKSLWRDIELEELKFVNKRMKMRENEE